MKLKKWFIVGVMVALAGFASAAVTTGTWILNYSNSLPSGYDYAKVIITADSESGVVSFNVDALQTGVYTDYPNFGIQTFGFNYQNVENPNSWTFTLPTDWSKANGGTLDGLGYFEITIDGNGNLRSDPLAFTITLPVPAYALVSNFAVPGDKGILFAAHVAGFNSDYKNAEDKEITSHWVGVGVVPAPGAILLAAMGTGLVGYLRRRTMI